MSAADSINSSVQGIAAESGKGVGSAGKGGSGSDGGATELFKVNQLYFRIPPTLSLVSKRTLLVNQAQRVTYNNPYNDVIVFIMNTGEYYISPTTSYLYMEIGYNSPGFDATPTVGNTGTISAPSGDANYNFAKALISQGNAMTLFEEVVYTSASGTEICREQNKGLEAAFRYRYEHTQQYIDTIGQIQGAAFGSYMANYDGIGPIFDGSIGGNSVLNFQMCLPVGGWDTLVLPRSGSATQSNFGVGLHNLNNTNVPYTGTTAATKYTSVCIPLDQVNGCFKPYMSTLMPAGALAGGRLELRLKNPIESLQFIAGCVEMNQESKAPGSQSGPRSTNIPSTYLKNLITANQSGLTINKIYIVFDAFQLQDNVLKRLNQISAGEDGLSSLFDTYDHTSVVANGTAVEVQVQQARSRITRSYCVVRDSANLNNPYINSLCAEAAVTRVSQACANGYTNFNNMSSGVTTSTAIVRTGGSGATAGTAANQSNQTGIDGSWTYLMYPSISSGPSTTDVPNKVAANAGTTAGWMPVLAVMGASSTAGVASTMIGTYYPFIEKPKLPNCIWTQSAPTVLSYQAQLGSLFFPQQPLTTPAEYYQNALYMFCKSIPDKTDNCSVSYQDFLGGLGWGLYDPTFPPVQPTPTTTPSITPGPTVNGVGNNPTQNDYYGYWVAPSGMAVYGMLAEKSQALQLSGLPIANARLLRHRFLFNGNPLSGGTRTINCFTQYTRIMKTFLGGRMVVRE